MITSSLGYHIVPSSLPYKINLCLSLGKCPEPSVFYMPTVNDVLNILLANGTGCKCTKGWHKEVASGRVIEGEKTGLAIFLIV